MSSSNGRREIKPPVQEVKIEGRNYSVRALQEAQRTTALVATVGERFLQKWLEGRSSFFGRRGRLPEDVKERQMLFNTILAHADQWQRTVSAFEYNEVERLQKKYEDAMPKGHSGSKLILPDAGLIEPHLRPGSIPHL